MLRFLVGEAGIRQFVDIGTGLPLVGSTHEVAQSLAAECRIAYVDNDPMVLSHARALLKSAPGGAVGYVDADVRDPAAIVAGSRGIIDYRRPVAVMLLFTLAYVPDADKAAAVVSALMAAVPSGSCRTLPPGEVTSTRTPWKRRPGGGIGWCALRAADDRCAPGEVKRKLAKAELVAEISQFTGDRQRSSRRLAAAVLALRARWRRFALLDRAAFLPWRCSAGAGVAG